MPELTGNVMLRVCNRDVETPLEMIEWGKFIVIPRIVRAKKMDGPFSCQTPGGIAHGNDGDYLALDRQGKPYPCSAEHFETSYKPLPENFQLPPGETT